LGLAQARVFFALCSRVGSGLAYFCLSGRVSSTAVCFLRRELRNTPLKKEKKNTVEEKQNLKFGDVKPKS